MVWFFQHIYFMAESRQLQWASTHWWPFTSWCKEDEHRAAEEQDCLCLSQLDVRQSFPISKDHILDLYWLKCNECSLRIHTVWKIYIVCVCVWVCLSSFAVCFQSSWLSITFSPPLWHKSARLTHCLRWSQAEDMVDPAPLSPASPHTHKQNQPPLHPTPTSSTLLSGFPLFHPVCDGTSGITSHISLAPCLLPLSTAMGGEGTPFAQHGSTFEHKPVIGPHYLWHFLQDY